MAITSLFTWTFVISFCTNVTQNNWTYSQFNSISTFFLHKFSYISSVNRFCLLTILVVSLSTILTVFLSRIFLVFLSTLPVNCLTLFEFFLRILFEACLSILLVAFYRQKFFFNIWDLSFFNYDVLYFSQENQLIY